jgi:hypothetical protein
MRKAVCVAFHWDEIKGFICLKGWNYGKKKFILHSSLRPFFPPSILGAPTSLNVFVFSRGWEVCVGIAILYAQSFRLHWPHRILAPTPPSSFLGSVSLHTYRFSTAGSSKFQTVIDLINLRLPTCWFLQINVFIKIHDKCTGPALMCADNMSKSKPENVTDCFHRGQLESSHSIRLTITHSALQIAIPWPTQDIREAN